MAETLGSLVDKLSIKNLRIWHLDEALEEKNASKLISSAYAKLGVIWQTSKGKIL